MGCLILPPSASNALLIINDIKNRQEGESSASTSTLRMVEREREKEVPQPIMNSNSSFQTRAKRKRSIHKRSASKRIRGIWNTSGILSSQFILSVWWFALAILLLCETNNNNNNLLFLFPGAQARPMSNMCTAVLTIPKLEYSPTVGIQDFGMSLSPLATSSYPYLTILPGNYKDLCQLQTADDLDYESIRFPPGIIATMVDLESGGCDVLTKATNALLLQKYLTKDLKYIIFYKSKDHSMYEIPKLDLDQTMPPTNQPTAIPTSNPSVAVPTTNPTTYYPTEFPTKSATVVPTSTASPTSSPSSSSSPTMSRVPSEAPFITEVPTEAPFTTGDPTTTTAPLNPTSMPSEDGSISEPLAGTMPSAEPNLSEAPSPLETTVTTALTNTAKPSKAPTTKDEEPTEAPTEDVDSVILRRSLATAFWQQPVTYDFKSSEETLREQQKKELEENDSMVFLTISMGDAHSILAGIYQSTNWEGGKTPEFSKPGNENWDMKMHFSTTQFSGQPPSCQSLPVPDGGKNPNPSFVTSRPTRAPISGVVYSPSNGKQPSGGSYQDNAPGTFTIFKFILFGLLIASPCLRLIHQWWAGGGRIRLRRSDDGESNRVVGFQYIPPMDNWFGMQLESTEVPRPPHRLTYHQIMALPEIRYTKPIHRDDNKLNTQTIEEKDAPGNNSSRSNCLFNEIDNNNDTLLQSDSNTEIIGTLSDNAETTIGGETSGDESVVSEASFENEPSVRLELPTSPLRVSSRSVTQRSNPLSPRAIVRTEEVPPDEESPEEQQQPEDEQSDLEQPSLTPASPRSIQEEPLEQEAQEEEQQPQTQTQTQPQPQQCVHQEGEPEIAPPLSFRTQRRMQSFTTTTCTTCSICIEEFEEGETLRLLPRCGHAFHTECILPWLQDRQGCCPLCKTEVLEPTPDDEDEGN